MSNEMELQWYWYVTSLSSKYYCMLSGLTVHKMLWLIYVIAYIISNITLPGVICALKPN